MRGRHSPLGPFAPEVQTLLAVDPVGLLVIDLPALTPQQDVDAARAITNAGGGDLADSLPLRTIISRVRAIKIGSLPQLNDCGGATNADAYASIRKLANSRLRAGLTAFFG
ncbi:hypothetical protein BKX93_17380 [Chromobacterium vaccinii]|uniref:Uncharacterized protein n=1 Tax=Chromobacterium vaccinii TaxID=1108595 RepID=A0A1D9LK59_9NEIS|nr:hypothetical protein BKX93_17380 [Chromobacterium vaccinii]